LLVRDQLTEDSIFIVPQSSGATDVIARLCTALAKRMAIDAGVLQRAVAERERARTTAFTNGAAIPHCRLPGLRRFGAAMMILKSPVQWDASGRSVDTVLLIVGPADHVSDHLRILANASQLLDSAAVRAKLAGAPDPASAYAVISAAEQALEQRRSEQGLLQEVRKEPRTPGQDQLGESVKGFNW
jgi:nitrogen PTS system EIIA component